MLKLIILIIALTIPILRNYSQTFVVGDTVGMDVYKVNDTGRNEKDDIIININERNYKYEYGGPQFERKNCIVFDSYESGGNSLTEYIDVVTPSDIKIITKKGIDSVRVLADSTWYVIDPPHYEVVHYKKLLYIEEYDYPKAFNKEDTVYDTSRCGNGKINLSFYNRPFLDFTTEIHLHNYWTTANGYKYLCFKSDSTYGWILLNAGFWFPKVEEFAIKKKQVYTSNIGVQNNDLYMYPNPTSGNIYIVDQNISKVLFTDINGREINIPWFPFKKGFLLETINLSKGLYFITLQIGHKKLTKKLIKL